MSQFKKTPVIIALALLAALATGYWLGHGRQSTTPAVTTAAPERKVLYWYDPMVPGQHFDKPGKSPFMDMALVAMYDSEQSVPGVVRIDSRVVENLGVRTAQVGLGNFSLHLDTVGYVNPDEHLVQVVQTHAAGWVEQLKVGAVNDTVKKGQLLLELYSPELVAAQQEYLLARQNYGESDSYALLQSADQKLSLLGLSARQITELNSNGKASRLIAFYAPSNGVVTDLGVRQGMQVTPGTNLFSLVDLSSVWVVAEIPENEAGWIRKGLTAKITLPAYPDQQYSGQIEYVYPNLATASRTLQVRIRLANPGEMLKPGMFANVSIADAVTRNVLAIPSEAVISTGQRNVVIVADGGGKFHPVTVRLGRSSNDQYEILDGLSAGQTIVLSGQFLIDSESNLKMALHRLQPADSTTMKTREGSR